MSNPNSHRDAQVMNWEKHLAGIIEQTNHNIDYLSRSVKRNEERSSIPPPPPPPPRVARNGRRLSAPPPPHSSSNRNPHVSGIPNSTNASIYQQHPSSGGASVSRPLSKEVEDDVTRRIGQSVKRAVERTITEKSHAGQARIDRLSDQLQNLSEDITKIQRDQGIASRSITSQDRLSKRLKDEWEKQRSIVKKLEAEMIKDLGWKEATKVDLKVMKDQQTQDQSLRVTRNELRSAMEAITSKVMVAVDKTTAASRTSFESDISVLREEVNALKKENEVLRENFNETHVKSIISSAVEGQFNLIEAKIASSVKSTINSAVKASKDEINIGVVDRVKDCLGREVMKGDGDFHNVISVIAEKLIVERDDGLIDKITSSLDFKKELNLSFEAQMNTFQLNIMKDVKAATREKIKDSKSDRDIMKKMVNQTMEDVKAMMRGHNGADSKVIEDLEARIVHIEQHSRDTDVNAEVMALRNDIQSVLDANYKNKTSLNRIRDDVSLIYNSTELKQKKVQNELKTYTDDHIKTMEDQCIELKRNFHTSSDLLLQFGNRIESLESVSKKNAADEEAINVLTREGTNNEGGVQKIQELQKNLNSIDAVIGGFRQEFLSLQQQLKSIEEKTKRSENNLQDLKYTSTKREDDLGKKVDLISRTCTDIETKSTTRTQDIENELRMVKVDVENIKGTEEKAKSSLSDLVSCYGKVSALENKINVELSGLRSEFMILQDNIIDVNSASQERMNMLVKEVRDEMSSAHLTDKGCYGIKQTEDSLEPTDSSTKASKDICLHQSRLEGVEQKLESIESDFFDIKVQASNVEESLKDFCNNQSTTEAKFLSVQARVNKLELSSNYHTNSEEKEIHILQNDNHNNASKAADAKMKRNATKSSSVTEEDRIHIENVPSAITAKSNSSPMMIISDNVNGDVPERALRPPTAQLDSIPTITSNVVDNKRSEHEMNEKISQIHFTTSDSFAGSIAEYDRIEEISELEIPKEDTSNQFISNATPDSTNAAHGITLGGSIGVSIDNDMDNSVSECVSSIQEESIATMEDSTSLDGIDVIQGSSIIGTPLQGGALEEISSTPSSPYDSSFESDIVS